MKKQLYGLNLVDMKEQYETEIVTNGSRRNKLSSGKISVSKKLSDNRLPPLTNRTELTDKITSIGTERTGKD
jgi:hypothetical protein